MNQLIERGDRGEMRTQEERTVGHPEPTDTRCKDFNPNPYIPLPPVCTDYVHYAPCVIAQGRERRDIRPWWRRIGEL